MDCKHSWASQVVQGSAIMAIATLASCSVPGCAPGPGSREPASELDLGAVRVIDLSYAYGDDTLYWPTSPSPFELTELAYGPSDGGYFYAAYSFCTPEHGGTHIDAPIHFSEGGSTVDEVSVRRLIAPGVVIDVRQAATADPDYRVTEQDVRAWEEINGTIPTGAIVLLRTGWSHRWPDALRYLGDDTPGDASNLHFPAYGEDVARLLVDQRRVAALGIDTASIDHGPSEDFVVHQIVAAAGVVALENVADLSDVPPVGSWILALPVKIGAGSGGPVRIVALVQE